MKSNIKSLLIVLCGIASCNAMQFNNNFNNQNNNTFNNQFINNMNNQNNNMFNNQFSNNMNNQNNFMFNNNLGMNNMNMFNNNIGMNNLNVNNNIAQNQNIMINNEIEKFYQDANQRAQYVQQKIESGNNANCIVLKNSNLTSFDLKLFLYNIKHSKPALSNASRLLRQLVSKSNININFLQNNFNCDSKKLGTNLSFLFDYYAGEIYKKGSDIDDGNDCTLSTALEIVTMIANYYLLSLKNGHNINIIQQQLYNSPFNFLLNNYNYIAYYNLYFFPRYEYQYQAWMNSGKNLLFNENNQFTANAVSQNWQKAVMLVQAIDLAGILNKVITAVNLSELQMYNVNELTTHGSIKQIILKNDKGKCWFNSTFQLLRSAVELSSNTTQNKLNKPDQGCLFIEFVNYLKTKSESITKNRYGIQDDFKYEDEGGYFDNDGHYIAKQSKGLSLINEIFEFEKKLNNNQKTKWNNILEVKEAKKQLKEIDQKYFMSGSYVGYEFFTRLFPELKQITYCNTNDQLAKGGKEIINYFPNSMINSVIHTSYNDYISDSNKKILLIPGNGNYEKFCDQIDGNKYLLSFDDQNNLHFYRLIGIQLKEGGHLTAFTKAANDSDDWNYYDSLGKYTVFSRPMIDIVNHSQDFSNVNKTVVAYVFKKYF